METVRAVRALAKGARAGHESSADLPHHVEDLFIRLEVVDTSERRTVLWADLLRALQMRTPIPWIGEILAA